MKQIFTIPAIHANERLDQALAKLMPDYSRTQIQSWIEQGDILVNSEKTKGKSRIKGGETVSFEAPIETKTSFEAENLPLSIVYEDETFLVVNKAAGMVTHPGAGQKNHTLLNALLYHAPILEQLPRAGILHRLDKDTSGLLVVAKTMLSFNHLTRQLKKRSIKREYQAIVYGRLISGGSINCPIGRHPIERKRMAVVETGKKAVTHYRILEKYRAHTRLHVILETGRTHQIRVHMAHLHHPLLGDQIYGGRSPLTKGMTQTLIQALRLFKRQALHAYVLGFLHPMTQEFVRFEIDLPEDMKELIRLLKNDMESP